MIEISTSQVGRSVTDCVVLHDLLVDVSRHMAGEVPGCMENTSRRLLHSYVSNIQRVEKKESSSNVGESSTSWYGLKAVTFRDSLIEVEDDEFILRNVFRLLRRANLFDHAIALLSDPRWLIKQIKACRCK